MHFSGKKVVLETRRFSRRISCPVWLFQAPEPSFPPIGIDCPGAELVVFRHAENTLENNTRGLHFHHLTGPLSHNLMDPLQHAKLPPAEAQHLNVKQKAAISIDAVQGCQ